MSTYPSSATLAAFRRDLNRADVADIAGHDLADFAWEREHGIGYRAAEGYAPEYLLSAPSEAWDGHYVSVSANEADRIYGTRARREAAAMRSRAYAAAGAWPFPSHRLAPPAEWSDARE